MDDNNPKETDAMDWRRFEAMIKTVHPNLADPKKRVAMLSGTLMQELKRAYEAGKYCESWHSDAARNHVKGGRPTN